MSVIGDAFVAIHPDSAGFAGKLQSQLSAVNLGGAGALLGASAVAGVVVGLAKIGQAFGSAKVQIQRETGATGAELQQTFDSVKNVLKGVPDSIGTVTTAIDELRRRGVPLGATLDHLATQTLDLARLTKSDLATTVESTTGLFNKYNVALRDQPAALDAIFKATQQGGKSLADVTSGLQAGGAVFQQFGLDLTHSAALIATLQKASISVQPALAGLKKAFGSITKEGGDPKAELQKLFNEFSDGTPKATAAADAIKLFGARSGAELVTALQQGKLNSKQLFDVITNGKGGIEATALATRTFGEELATLKNQVLVDLQPLGTEVWTTLRAAILSATEPVGDLVRAFARLGQALSPLLTAIGVLVAVGFGALLGVVSLVARGLDTVASVLEHVPGPVLIAAGAVAVLTKALLSLGELGALSSVGDFAAGAALGLESILNPVTLVIGALALIGGAMVIFGGKTSAASKEAKDLSKTLFDTADSGHVFASGITSAAQGLATFLTKQDAAGKIKDLDKALDGTGLTLTDVSRAVTGTAEDFRGLQKSLADKLGIPAVAVAFSEMDVKQQSVLVQTGKVSGATIDLANKYGKAAEAIGQQRDAFIQSSEAQIQLVAHTSPANAAIAAQAEAIAHATTGTRGYGAALDFLNEALTEQAAKQDKVKIASQQFAPALAELRSQIVKGNITTDDAATAASKWGISLDSTKKIISDTQAAFKSFVDGAVAGLPSSTDAVNQWSQDVQSAFTAFAQATAKSPAVSAAGDAAVAAASARLTHAQTQAAATQASATASAQASLDAALARQAAAVSGTAAQQASAAAAVTRAQQQVASAATKGSSSVVSAQAAVDAAYAKSGKAAGQNAADTLKAQQALSAALDPENVVKKVQAQAQQIVDFQTNILRLVKQFPAAARALLEDPDKTAAAAFAASLVNKPAIAAQFNQAEGLLQVKTRDLKDISKGLADQFLSGGEQAGTAGTTGIAKTFKPVPVVSVQTQAALDSLAKQKEFAQAAGDLGAVATIGMQQKMILANVAQSSVAGAAAAVTAGTGPIADAAGKSAKIATGRYADGLDVKGKTTTAIAESADAWNGAITATTASSARAGGRVVGFQFGKGIIDGMRLIDPQVQTAATVLGNNVAAATRGAMKQSSPSKVGIEIGANFGASIGIGIVQGASEAVSSANVLVGRIVGAVGSLKAKTEAVAATVRFDLPPVRIRTDVALADMRVLEAVLAKLRRDVGAAATDPLAAKAVPQDLRNLQAAYATFNRTQVKPQTAAQQVAADTKAAAVALFTFAADFNRFKTDASKAPLLAAELKQVKATTDALAAARARLAQPPVIPPIKVDVKFGRLPEVPPLELGVFLPRVLPRPVVHIESDVSAVLRAAEELRGRFRAERVELPFGIAPDAVAHARSQIADLADTLDRVRALVPQLPAEKVTVTADVSAVERAALDVAKLAEPVTIPVGVDATLLGRARDAVLGLRGNLEQVALDGSRLTVAPVVKVTADTSALLAAVRDASGIVSKPVVVPFHGDTTKLVADVQGALGKVTAARATVTAVAPATLSARLMVPTPQLVAAGPAPATQTIVKEANVKVELHKVDPPDPLDLAREIGWRLG